jgi:hypothetical protein
MEIGIVGLPGSGKSTLFEIMTGANSREARGESFVRGLATVPDERFDHLVRIFHPAKISPAKVPFVDVGATGEKTWNTIRQTLSGTDALLHVVDGFSGKSVRQVIPFYRKLEEELVFSDLVVVENRLERLGHLSNAARKHADTLQMEILPRLKEQLERGKVLRELDLTPEDTHALRGFAFWTSRPEMVVINTAEDNPLLVDDFLRETGITVPVIGICCQIEAEIAAMPPEEQRDYLHALGISEPAFERVIRTAFFLLGRICYFTVGEDEVKAWVVPAGTKAPKAAAVIHKDFERGFIKAEVVGFDDFVACGNTLSGAKAKGKLRLEGKEYVVKDGDIISFRFNV